MSQKVDLYDNAYSNYESDPYRLLLESDLPVIATMFEGKLVFGSGKLA